MLKLSITQFLNSNRVAYQKILLKTLLTGFTKRELVTGDPIILAKPERRISGEFILVELIIICGVHCGVFCKWRPQGSTFDESCSPCT